MCSTTQLPALRLWSRAARPASEANFAKFLGLQPRQGRHHPGISGHDLGTEMVGAGWFRAEGQCKAREYPVSPIYLHGEQLRGCGSNRFKLFTPCVLSRCQIPKGKIRQNLRSFLKARADPGLWRERPVRPGPGRAKPGRSRGGRPRGARGGARTPPRRPPQGFFV